MTQHARITPDQVQAMRGLGLLTIPGYLYLYILSRRRVGWALKIPSVVQFCRDLKIHRASYYSAVAKLKKHDLIDVGDHAMTLTLVSDSPDGLTKLDAELDEELEPGFEFIPDPPEPPESPVSEKSDRVSEKSDRVSEKSDRVSEKSDRGTGKKQSGQGFGKSSNSLTTSEQSSNKERKGGKSERERKDSLNFENRSEAAQSMDRLVWSRFLNWLEIRRQNLPVTPQLTKRWILAMTRDIGIVNQFLATIPHGDRSSAGSGGNFFEISGSSKPMEKRSNQSEDRAEDRDFGDEVAIAIARLRTKLRLFPSKRGEVEKEAIARGIKWELLCCE